MEAIASPLNLESSWQLTYCTVSSCLMEWPPKYILISLKRLVFEKRMDLVLSPPKWIDSLLATNRWHSDENSLFKTFSIFWRPHVGRKYSCHLDTNRSLHLIMIGEDHLYLIEKGAAQEQSLVVHHALMFQPQKKHYQYKPKLSAWMIGLKIWLQMSGKKLFHFFKENSMV